MPWRPFRRVQKLTSRSPLSSTIAAFLDHVEGLVRRRQRADGTLRRLRFELRRCAPLGRVSLERLTVQRVLRWFEELADQTSHASAVSSLCSLRTVLYWAQRHGHVGRNAAANLRIVHSPEPGRPFSLEELGRLHAALDDVEADLVERARGFRRRPHAVLAASSAVRVLRLLELTGARVGEASSIRREELRLRERHVLRRETKTGPRAIPLNAEARDLLERQAAESAGFEFLFPAPLLPRHHVGVRTVEVTMARACEAADLQRSPHDLRYNFAFWALYSGVDIDSLSQALGHRDSRVTRVVYGRHNVLTPRAMHAADLVGQVLRGQPTTPRIDAYERARATDTQHVEGVRHV